MKDEDAHEPVMVMDATRCAIIILFYKKNEIKRLEGTIQRGK